MTVLQTKEGKAPFSHPSIPPSTRPETYYRILGDLSSTATPIVALHGGPGIPHVYLAPLFSAYHALTQTPVILYDQIGCGRSTRFPSKIGDRDFWTVELFIAELENLLSHLGVERFDLYGHSWGAMLGAVVATPSSSPLAFKVRRLVLASGPASMKLWEQAQHQWLKSIPGPVRKAIENADIDKDYESDEYKAAVLEYYKVHLCRVWPFPEALSDAFAELEKDPTVYSTMCGPSEITITGSLRTYNWIEKSTQIKAPTLLINGEFDEASDLVVKPWFHSIRKVKWVVISDGGHCVHLEQLEKYAGVLKSFLQDEE
ncbi:L-amino acid amidase [Colletotrichum spaethianum]|uniref:L-amino acid amidase n=1 Tax=Colletotrichum spaethianum TaxID=700344 RepID=A0AA37PE74_9PEZI|nr:L-amino acid amidase [Colletotrichum spaethianum]GKT50663.1 L-amino acid amidase [Colletotrichum spaethianum]